MDPRQIFQPYFEHFGQKGAPPARGVNTAAVDDFQRELTAPIDAPGRGLLLRAPRAGYGKSHVLCQLRERLASSHEMIPMRAVGGHEPDPRAAIEDTLRRLTRQLPAGGGLTPLDIHTRGLLAHALEPLVVSGEVPCQDRDSAVHALRQRAVETLDFHHPQAVTAHWTRENFEVLGPRLSLEISRSTGCSLNQVAFWIAALFRFAVTSPEHPGRAGNLLQTASANASVECFGTLLGLLSRFRRVVLIADDLEGLHDDPKGARALAGFLASVRQEAPRVDVLLSINDDVWESAFRPALSGGLADRLSEVTVRLDGLSDGAIHALLESRCPGAGRALQSRLELAPDERYPRTILRRAAEIFARDALEGEGRGRAGETLATRDPRGEGEPPVREKSAVGESDAS